MTADGTILIRDNGYVEGKDNKRTIITGNKLRVEVTASWHEFFFPNGAGVGAPIPGDRHWQYPEVAPFEVGKTHVQCD